MLNKASKKHINFSKTALVTGSSSGFGELIALELAYRGFHVFASMRDTTKNKKLPELIKKKTKYRIDQAGCKKPCFDQ